MLNDGNKHNVIIIENLKKTNIVAPKHSVHGMLVAEGGEGRIQKRKQEKKESDRQPDRHIQTERCGGGGMGVGVGVGVTQGLTNNETKTNKK